MSKLIEALEAAASASLPCDCQLPPDYDPCCCGNYDDCGYQAAAVRERGFANAMLELARKEEGK